ncbi:unnamed protein product, partial [Acidithrix sp. C25]
VNTNQFELMKIFRTTRANWNNLDTPKSIDSKSTQTTITI